MSHNFPDEEAFSGYPSYGDASWLELRQLAQRAGVSTEHLCQTVENTTHFARTGKAVEAPEDDLEAVIRTLAADPDFTDFDLEGKSITEWHEWQHHRDEFGRFSDGSSKRDGVSSPLIPTSSSLLSYNHTTELQELHRVHNVLQQLYPKLTNRWKGELEIYPQSQILASGQKSWECQIILAQDLMNQPVKKLCVQIHEGFHALSPTTKEEYARAPKWEEGAIEGAVRIHRTEVARQLRIGISQSMFEARDKNHPYNRYVDALETMRNALGIGDVRGFYDHLMSIPADKMEDYILSEASLLTGREKENFPRRFAVAKAILEDRFKP
ncbi:hypothetical protein EON83_28380 [bacterium]|nr:MAG: hypothetical protein EON83_28380 [bacterium]